MPSEIAQAERTTKKAETLTATDFYLYDKTDLKNKLALLQEPEDFSEVKVFETCVFFFFALLGILYRESYKTVLKQNKKAAERHTPTLKAVSSAGCGLNLVKEGISELVFQGQDKTTV